MKNIGLFMKKKHYFLKKYAIFFIIIIFSNSLPFLEEDRKTERFDKIPLDERIVVIARLPEEGASIEKTPASVTVITSEEIESSGAKNLQDLLCEKASIIFFDDVGNGVETTVDMRGFNEGTALAVLLDGVRINEPDDNRVNLEQIPLSSIERIEIYRGSSSSTFGAGALSGTINIVTKSLGESDFLQVHLSYGSYQTDKEGLTGAFKIMETGIFFDLNREHSDGFRENGEYDLSHFFIKSIGSYGTIDSLSLAFLHNEGSLGAPGSLTEDEINKDRFFSPFNKVDGSDERLNQLTVRIDKTFERRGKISANFFYRGNSINTLTTGRWLSGFETESQTSSSGFVTQYSVPLFPGHNEISLSAGLESQVSGFSSLGFFTDSSGHRISSTPDSSNETDILKTGIFAQVSMDLSRTVSLLAGARFDFEDLDYKDRLDASIKGSTRFSEVSLKGGMNINPSDDTGFYLLYSEAFLPPTVYDLFAFPLFGSNPDLEPTSSRNYEAGIRKKFGHAARIHLSLFRINVKDEVVFVMTDPMTFTGRNENVGRSRRDGLELYSEIQFSKTLSTYLYYTYMNATLKSGENSGKRIPLVPKNKVAIGLVARWGHKDQLRISLSGRYVGKQYLTGDELNQWEPLEEYTTLDARISKRWKKFKFFIEAKNLLDEDYSTRGITNGFDLFYTPAPGRRIFAGMEYRITF